MPVPGKAKGESSGEPLCVYDIAYEGRESRFIARCRECGRKASLKEGVCLASAVGALSREFVPDTLVTSHYMETQYSGPAVELLRRMAKFSTDMDHLALRDPAQGAQAGQGERCAACPHNPRAVYPALRQRFGADPVAFFDDFTLRARALRGYAAANAGEPCPSCTGATESEFSLLLDNFEALVRFVMKEGFQIVVA